MAEEFVALIKFQSDPTTLATIQSDIKSLSKDPIKLTFDDSDLRRKAKDISSELSSSLSKGFKGINSDIFKGAFSSSEFKKVNDSLSSISVTLKDVSAALGRVDENNGLTNILETVNKLSSALGDLKGQLGSIGNVNIGFSVGGNSFAANAKYGSYARNEAIPQLKSQLNELEQFLKEYYKANSEITAVSRLISQVPTSVSTLAGRDPLDIANQLFGDMGGSLSAQIDNYKYYIDEIQKIAQFKGIDLSPVTSQFSTSADEIIKSVDKIRSGEADIEDQTARLKGIFGGLDDEKFEGLTSQLKEIITSLDTIAQKIEVISSRFSLTGTTTVTADMTAGLEQLRNLLTSFDSGNIDAAREAFEKVRSSLHGIGVDIPVEQLEHMQDVLAKLGFGSSDIEGITREIDALGIKVTDITTKFAGEGSDGVVVAVRGLDQMGRQVRTSIEAFSSVNKKTEETKYHIKNLGTTIRENFTVATEEAKGAIRDFSEDVRVGFENDRFAKDLDNVQHKFNAIESASTELNDAMSRYKTALDALEKANTPGENQAVDTKAVSQAYIEYQHALEQVNNQLRINENAQRAASDAMANYNNVQHSLSTDQFARELETVQSRFDAIKSASPELTAALNNYKLSLDSLKTANESGDINNVSAAYNNYKDALETVNNQLKINEVSQRAASEAMRNYKAATDGIVSDKFIADLDNAQTRFDALATKSPELVSALENYKLALDSLKAANETGDVEAISSAYVEYKNALELVNNQLKINENSQKVANKEAAENAREASAAYRELLDVTRQIGNKRITLAGLDKSANPAQVSQLLSDITALETRAGQLKQQLGTLPPERLNELTNLEKSFSMRIDEANAKLKDSNSALSRLGTAFKSSFMNAAMYMFSGYRVFQTITRAIRSAYTNIVEIDAGMTELKKVTDETNESYNTFLQNAGKTAVELGTTVTDYINSTADFARLGNSFTDSQELAKVANVYSVVGDDIDSIDEASQSIISTMAAFGVEAKDAMSIVDKFNEVGKKLPSHTVMCVLVSGYIG